MPLCGFNEKMLEVLRMFSEGLVEHGLIERSKAKSQDVQKTLDKELLDIEGFLQEIPNISDQQLRNVVKGLSLYARGVYGLMNGQDVSQYPAIVRGLNTLFFEMDGEYYSHLEGRPHAMSELVSWINQEGTKVLGH